MTFQKGQPKKGGKKKGTKHKKPYVSFSAVKESCERLQCNPSDFLVALVQGDRVALGLTSRQKIELRERQKAAQFLLSRLEHSPPATDGLTEEFRRAQIDYLKAKTAELGTGPVLGADEITIEVED